MEFYKVEQDVKEILKGDMAARCDDMALYANYVYKKLDKDSKAGGEWLISVFSDRHFRIIHGIAPYGTVSRVRRILQARYEELKPTKELLAERKRAERDYILYAKGAKK